MDASFTYEILVALVATIFFLFPKSFFKKNNFLLSYLFICLPFILTFLPFLRSPNFLEGDTLTFHYPVFKYIADSLKTRHCFPQWFSASGGVRIGYFHMNLFFFLPHKIFGYLLYSLLPVNVIFVYKLSYILGVIITCLGWWLVLENIVHSYCATSFGTLMVMMGGTGIAFHQEQVLATVHLMPWFILSLLKLESNPKFIFPLIILAGISLSTHYPQIQLITLGLAGLVMFLAKPRVFLSIWRKQKKSLCWLPVIFLLTLLPLLYIYLHMGNLASLMRNSETLCPKSYQDYLSLARIEKYCSAWPSHFYQYIHPVFEFDSAHLGPEYFPTWDRCSFYVGRVALVFSLLGACSSFPSGATVFLLLVIFTALTLGIYSPLPLVKYLFALHFPFLAIFRQWYHFFPMVNFCLSLLAAMGFAIFAKALSKKNKSIATYLLGFVFFLQALDLANYDRKYFYTFKKAQAAQEIKETLYTQWLLPPANLLTYKERFRLSYFYPEVIPPLPLLTNDREDIAAALERGWVLRRFSAEGKKAAFGVSQYTGPGSINSVGLSLDTEAAASAMLLVPLNYGLGVKAYIDGSQTKTLKVNSALTGILVGEGRHRIEFRIAPDWYKPILWLQVFFYLLLVVFFIRNRRLLTSHSSD